MYIIITNVLHTIYKKTTRLSQKLTRKMVNKRQNISRVTIEPRMRTDKRSALLLLLFAGATIKRGNGRRATQLL